MVPDAADVTTLRLALRDAGYPPVPVDGKAPHLEGWAQACLTANDREIRAWGRTRPQESNTGIVAGAIVGVDIDVLDEALADAVQTLAGKMLGATPLVRVGRAPKRLLVYRTAAPFRKCATAELFLPDAPSFGKDHKHHVEVLGQGQQFVAFGTHPETRAAYSWVTLSPLEVEAAALPAISAEMAAAFVAAAERLLRGAGCLSEREIRGREAEGRESLAPAEVPEAEVVAAALRSLPNDCSYDEWVRVGLALYGALGAGGRGLWEEWSARSAKNDPAVTAKKWPTFASGTSIGAGTLIWLARQHGWQPPRELRRNVSRETRRPNGNGTWHEEEPAAAAEAVGADLGEWDAADDEGRAIPPRGWLLGNLFCRGFLSSLIGDGGVGKTALRHVQLLSLATGRDLCGEHVFQRSRVLIVSLEDNDDELRRRIRAAMLHHGISYADLRGWLFLTAIGRKVRKLAKIATMDSGTMVEGQLATMLAKTIVRRNIDLVSLDPFVKTHRLPENDNTAIDAVVEILADLAGEHNIALDVPHHMAKGPADPGNPDKGRGASAFKDGGRLIYTLNKMTSQEAEGFGISEAERRLLIRMDSGKVNIAPPASEARWFRLLGVPLGNATELYPEGDTVQTAACWTPPKTWAGLSHIVLNQILNDIEAGLGDGERYSAAPNAGNRAAWKVVLEHAPDRTEKQAREIIRTWLRKDSGGNHGVLFEREYTSNERREPVKGLYVNATRRPS
jgi:hypothetical protein